MAIHPDSGDQIFVIGSFGKPALAKALASELRGAEPDIDVRVVEMR